MPKKAGETLIKICGLFRPQDIRAVNDAGPDYIGFVFAHSRRRVTPEQAFELRSRLRAGIIPVGVFVNEAPENISALLKNGVIDMVQLHGDEDEAYISKIDAPVIKAIKIMNSGDAQKWRGTKADYLLFDGKNGGGGKTFDWDLIGSPAKPFFLAGGLDINNIQAAIEKVHPYAADVSSGVETDGLKDYEKIQAIVSRVRQGWE